jgi:hypothetical protein
MDASFASADHEQDQASKSDKERSIERLAMGSEHTLLPWSKEPLVLLGRSRSKGSNRLGGKTTEREVG